MQPDKRKNKTRIQKFLHKKIKTLQKIYNLCHAKWPKFALFINSTEKESECIKSDNNSRSKKKQLLNDRHFGARRSSRITLQIIVDRKRKLHV